MHELFTHLSDACVRLKSGLSSGLGLGLTQVWVSVWHKDAHWDLNQEPFDSESKPNRSAARRFLWVPLCLLLCLYFGKKAFSIPGLLIGERIPIDFKHQERVSLKD